MNPLVPSPFDLVVSTACVLGVLGLVGGLAVALLRSRRDRPTSDTSASDEHHL